MRLLVDLGPGKHAIIGKYPFVFHKDISVVKHDRAFVVDKRSAFDPEEKTVHDHRCAVIKRAANYKSNAAVRIDPSRL